MPVILTFIATAAASWAIGKIVDYAWKKGEEVINGETDENRIARKSAAESGATQSSILALQKSLKGGLANNEKSLSEQNASLLKLERATSQSDQTMKAVIQSMRWIEGSVDKQMRSAGRIQYKIHDSGTAIRASIGNFKADLSRLNSVGQTISAKVEMLEKQFGDALRLGLAEHEAWKAERSILRFYRDFKFHEEVAEEECQLGKYKTIEDSTHVQNFVKSMRSPLNGITTDLWKLRDTYALLDKDPTSSRSMIYQNFRDSVKEYNDQKITIAQLRDALKLAFDSLTGSYTLATLLICYISPSEAYQAHYSQNALLDLEDIAEKLDSCLPKGDEHIRKALANRP